MNRLVALAAASLIASLAGCVGARPRPPPAQAFQLGMLRADYRDYRSADICAAEPRWLLDELRAPLAIVNKFVTVASRDPQADWSPESIAFVREAARTLPPLVETLQANLRAARDCRFRGKPGFPALLRDGPRTCEAALRLAPSMPALVEHLEARRVRTRWQAAQKTRENRARYECAGKDATIFYAKRTCDGAQVWLFCDGTRVRQEARQERMEWTPGLWTLAASAAPSARKSRQPRVTAAAGPEAYFAAAEKVAELDRCPALPPAPPVASTR